MRKIIITGVTGQDGSHMADYLLKNTEHTIIGGVRRLSVKNHKNIEHLKDNPRFFLIDLDVTDAQNTDRVIAEHKPDMLWVDPLLCYLSGDPNSSEDMSAFTNHLDELAMETDTLIHLIHHTGKPKTGRDTQGFTTADISYAGLGSSVLTNWARAIMVLQGERGAEGVFRLTAAKRGKRAQMTQDDLQPPALQIYLKHSDKGLCWLPSDYEPSEPTIGRTKVDVPMRIYKGLLQEPGKTYPTRSNLADAMILLDEVEVGHKTLMTRIKRIINNGDISENEQGHLIWTG